MTDINNYSNNALLVHIDNSPIEISNSKEEFCDLTRSANIKFKDTIYLTKKNKNIGIKYYIGKGDVSLIEKEARKIGVKLVIFNVDLSPSQERNLEILL